MHDFCADREEEGNTHILLTDYLSEVSLLTDQDSEGADDAPKVTLMTIHSAKGLEFKNVFVVGLEENLFPSPMAGDSYKQLEEERRLFYVAITRAEEHCFLSFAKTRFKYGKVEFSNPSRFLKDIDARYLNLPQEDIVSRKVEEGRSVFAVKWIRTLRGIYLVIRRRCLMEVKFPKNLVASSSRLLHVYCVESLRRKLLSELLLLLLL